MSRNLRDRVHDAVVEIGFAGDRPGKLRMDSDCGHQMLPLRIEMVCRHVLPISLFQLAPENSIDALAGPPLRKPVRAGSTRAVRAVSTARGRSSPDGRRDGGRAASDIS